MTLLLASRSATRRAMLEAAGVDFRTCETTADEEREKARLVADGADPRSLARALAVLKARGGRAEMHDLVLGADQTLERQDGSMLGKPGSREEAAEQLRSLGGRTHQLHSAAAIVEAGTVAWEQVESVSLTVRPLSEAFICAYLDREYEAIRHNVGGYRIEGPGVQLFERIEGSHFAILGLPLLGLLAFLRRRSVIER